jgi:predicted CoA-binding protein
MNRSNTKYETFFECLQAHGFTIVPVVPTEDMIDQGSYHTFQAYDGDSDEAFEEAKKCWIEMLAISKSRQREAIIEVIDDCFSLVESICTEI